MDIFLSNYLLSSQGDRVAMAHSLEIRLPFLDHRVIEFSFRLPPHWRINGLNEKYLLKRAFRKFIPNSIKNRAKQPYRAPIREVFFSQSQPKYCGELLSDDALKKAGLFDAKKVYRLITRLNNPAVQQISEIHNMAFMGILSTQLLYHQFIENFPWRPFEVRKPDKIIRVGN
jgi:asparagine synthase (glutamine-hydrolysing)